MVGIEDAGTDNSIFCLSSKEYVHVYTCVRTMYVV